MTTPAPASQVKVIVAGGGIGGLICAQLLEAAKIDYVVLERAVESEYRPLGSAIAIASAAQDVLDQLGVLDDINANSKPQLGAFFMDEALNKIGTADTSFSKERYGRYFRVLSRAKLHKILMSRVPMEKLLFGKSVITTAQDEHKVTVRCKDGSAYTGDILIGADGAYSVVRANMFMELASKKLLPTSDSEKMTYSHHCVVGTTQPLDPTKYPVVLEKFSNFQIVLGESRQYAWWMMPVEDHKVCWMIVRREEEARVQDESYVDSAASNWGPQAAEDMCKEVEHFCCPYGGTVGDLIQQTDKNRISKIRLEEKFFESWYHGRTVLIGDACHKVIPHGGQGAVSAIYDSVSLINELYDLESNTPEGITKAFHAYYENRKGPGKTAVDGCRQVGEVLGKKGWMADLIRKISFNYVPRFLMVFMGDQTNWDRPQARFLPLVPPSGVYKAKPVSNSSRYLREQRTAALV